jgi:hypothetical protein
MKKYNVLLFIALILLVNCTEVPTLTVVEIMRNSGKQWRVVLLQKEGGAAVSPSVYANVRYQFNANGTTATTYQATGVGGRGIVGEGDKPNYASSANQGNWDAQLGGKLIFEPKTTTESEVSFIEIPKASDRIVKLKWTVPEDIDKLIPTYIMHLEKID